jgi:hypothetical protein
MGYGSKGKDGENGVERKKKRRNERDIGREVNSS